MPRPSGGDGKRVLGVSGMPTLAGGMKKNMLVQS